MIYALALLFQIVFLIYRQFIVLVDLYPFNDLERYPFRLKLPEIIVNAFLMILPPIGFIWDIESLKLYALFFYPANLIGSFCIWWVPYFFGPGFGHRKLFEGLFGRTVRLLPPIKGRPAPDAQHMLLHIISLVTTILTFIAYFHE